MSGVEIPVTTPGGAEAATILRAIAEAMRGVGTEAATAGAKAEAVKSAFSFNEVRQAVTSFAHDVSALAHDVADLVSEQSRLDRVSERLGLDFNAAADAAGKYTDATTAMTAAARLAEAGVSLTQEQLNALSRVAGNYAATTGQDLNASIEQLTGALLNGEQEGLRRFGPALAAVGGTAHTTEERLTALVGVARTVPQATDDAADSLRRFEGNLRSAARELSTGFLEELQRLERESNRAAGTLATDSDSITAHWREVGEVGALAFHKVEGAVNLVAEAMAHTVYTAGRLLTAISEIRAHPLSIGDIIGRFDADVRASSARLVGAARALVGAGGEAAASGAREVGAGVAAGASRRRVGVGAEEESAGTERSRYDVDEAAQSLKGNIARRMGAGGASSEAMKSAKAAQMAADERDRQRDLAQMRATKEFYAELVRQARDYENAIHGAAESWGEQITHAHELARIQARIAGLSTEAQAANEVRLARARMAQQRAEGGISARAEMSDLRDPSTRAARIEEMAQQHQLQRERAHLEQRYQLQRTYSDRMEELHGQEFNSTQALAEGVSGAFQKMGEALEMHIEGLINGKESVGEALQGMLADTLGMIGKQAFVKGAMETAEGISALAGIVTAPLAPGHFAAAAAYFGVGALATAAGYGVASIGGGSAPASASAAPSQPAARVSKGSASSGGEGGTIINVAFGGPMYGTGGVRQAAREITGVVNRGAIQGGVQLLPGVLMGGGAGS